MSYSGFFSPKTIIMITHSSILQQQALTVCSFFLETGPDLHVLEKIPFHEDRLTQDAPSHEDALLEYAHLSQVSLV